MEIQRLTTASIQTYINPHLHHFYMTIAEDKYIPPNPNYFAETDTNTDDIFILRKSTLQRKAKLLQEQIQERKNNLEDNLREIEQDLCQCGTIVLQVPRNNPEAKDKIILKYKLPLYREARQQRTDYLRDTALLKRELLDTKLQYLSLKDKEVFLQ